MAQNWREQLSRLVAEENLTFDLPMETQTTMRVGGAADAFVAVKDEETLLGVLRFARGEGIPLFVMGKGSNLIVRQRGIRGIVLQIDIDFLRLKGVDVEVGAGYKLPMLAREAMQKNLAGLEFAQGIPGSVGGAVVMNAGAYERDMSSVLVEARYVDAAELQIQEKTLSGEDFSYRDSFFARHKHLLLSAKMKLARDMDGAGRKRFDQYRKLRMEKQPLEHPSAGSVFKRPPGHFAGALIEGAGLKGLRIGGAAVSQKHAGFIVNDQNATANDVIALIAEVQKRVLAHSGVELECEVKIVGEEE